MVPSYASPRTGIARASPRWNGVASTHSCEIRLARQPTPVPPCRARRRPVSIGAMTPVEPKPAASVILVRAAAGAPEPLDVYMIRRQKGMKFLGGYYAFPGGKVDAADTTVESLARCRGLSPAEAADRVPPASGVPPLAFWMTAVRELLEESGVLLACDDQGRPILASDSFTAETIERCRKDLMAGARPFPALLAREGWYADARPLVYLSHFVTPTSSPIRFTARFFLCLVPPDQTPRLFTEETSEGFWIHPGEGYRRFVAGEMAMAEPAEYALGYLAQFASLEELRAATTDGREKFHGIVHRIDVFWQDFDWKQNRFPPSK
jgi:endoribonuclease LACTB2